MSAPQHALYLPRLLLEWLSSQPDVSTSTRHGTMLYADVSGFTALSDQLAGEMGRGGSEEITRVMNEAFSELVEILFLEHGDLLRFGGDALVAIFLGDHDVGRAARAAVDMRDAIREVDAGPVDLDISIGIATGEVVIDLVGDSDREMLLSGEAVDRVIAAEETATAGQILLTDNLADVLGEAAEPAAGGFLELLDDPDIAPLLDEPPDVRFSANADFSAFISPDFRDRLTLSVQQGEHRTASIGFVRFEGLRDIDESERQAVLDRLYRSVMAACDRHDVAYISADIDDGGGKFILAAGVPRRASGREGVAAALFDIVTDDHGVQVSGGCARGYVFACDLGAPARRVTTVMGDTVNLAARLAAAAGPSQVLVTEAALERSLGIFETDRLPAIELKGKSKAVSPFVILSAEVESDAEAVISLFGRDAERQMLSRTIYDALDHGGGTVAIVAETGMGKGLLAETLTEQVDATVYDARCERNETRAYASVERLLAQVLGLDPEDSISQQLADIVAEHAPDLAPWVPLIGRVFRLDLEPTPEVSALGEEFVASRLAESCNRLLWSVVGDDHLVIRLEDVDFLDHGSREVFRALAASAHEHRTVLLLTARTAPDWVPSQSFVFHLEPFDEATSDAYVRWVLGDDVLPAQTIDAIVARGGGNPFTLRELTASAAEGGEVPDTVEAAALARMDRLDQRDKQLLCYAAVLGVEARIDLLASLLPEIAAAVEDAESWDRLADFVDTSTVGKIRFRDPVVRDVAYGMLPHSRRIEIHSLVAATIERRARRRPERFVNDLSYHFHLAEDWANSWKYARMAGDRAERDGIAFDAVRAWETALAAAKRIEVPNDELIEVWERLGDDAERAGMFPKAIAALERAADLNGDASVARRIDRKIGLVEVHLGRSDEARAHFESVLASVEDVPDHDHLQAMLGIAGLEIRRGDFTEAASWCDRLLAETDEVEHPASVARAHYIRALASSRAGWSDAADHAKRALEIYEQLGDRAGAANALNNLGYHAFFSGEWAACEEYYVRCLAAREALGDVLGRALAGYNLGELFVEQGRYAEAEPLLRRALADFRGAAHPVGEAATRVALGRLEARFGRVSEAVVEFEKATEVATQADAGEQVVEAAVGRAELALLRGEALQALDALESIESNAAAETATHRAQTGVLRAYASHALGDEEAVAPALSGALAAAAEAGVRHLVYAVREGETRLLGGDSSALESNAAHLGIVARPWFRPIAVAYAKES